MRIRVVLLILSFFSIGTTYAQQNGEFIYHPFMLNNDSFTGIQLISDIAVGSSSLNFGMMKDFMFSDRFSESNKQKFIDNNTNRTNVFYSFSAGLNYHLASSRSRVMSLTFNNMSYYSSNSDIAKLGLFGNKPYAGKELNSDQNRVSNFAYTDLDYTEVVKNNDNWFMSISGGISFLHTYRSVEVGGLSLFTAEDGDHIDVAIDEGRFSVEEAGLDGIGLNAGFKIAYKWSDQNYLGVELSDLGLNYLFNTTEYSIDTNARFEGITLSFNDFESGDLNTLTDSLIDQALYADSSAKHFVSVPVSTKVYYQRMITDGQLLSIMINTRDHGYYGMLSALSYHKVGKKYNLITSLSYGSFSGWNLNAQVEYKMKKWHGYAAANGLLSWIVPGSFSYSGFSVGVARAL